MTEPTSDLAALVQRTIAEVRDLAPEDVHPDAELADLGVDSLAAAELLVELELALDQRLPLDLLRALQDARTVGDVTAPLEAALGAP